MHIAHNKHAAKMMSEKYENCYLCIILSSDSLNAAKKATYGS